MCDVMECGERVGCSSRQHGLSLNIQIRTLRRERGDDRCLAATGDNLNIILFMIMNILNMMNILKREPLRSTRVNVEQ